MVGIVGSGLQTGDLFVAAVQCGLHYLQGTLHHFLFRLAFPGYHVSALLTDGGKHLAGDPSLEPLGAVELRREDEGVKAALVDEDGLLGSAQSVDGVVFHDVIIINVSLQ